MQISQHANERTHERGLDQMVLMLMEEILTPKYINQSRQIFLDRKKAENISRILRKAADKVDKHKGTLIVLDDIGTLLITAYRKK
jgi:hypothetical protein